MEVSAAITSSPEILLELDPFGNGIGESNSAPPVILSRNLNLYDCAIKDDAVFHSIFTVVLID